jgi:cobalt-zinc-cadmium efflux system protein
MAFDPIDHDHTKHHVSAHHHSTGGAGHHHGHHHHTPQNYNRAFLLGLLLNTGFVGLEFSFGVWAQSIALIADAGHNLSDVLSLILAWGASSLARRRPSRQRTYGWRKSSILAALLNAIFLLVVTGGIAWEAIKRFNQVLEVKGMTLIVVAAVGIVINTSIALLFMSGRKRDLNIRAAFQHMAADALVSLGVVIAGIIIIFTCWYWLDPAFSLIISALIILNTWDVLKDSLHLAIDGVPAGLDERAVRTYLLEQPNVAQIHDLHIWGISTTEVALTAHLVMPTGHPGDRFLVEMYKTLHDQFGIDHATIQIELGDTDIPCKLEPEHLV